MARKKKRLSQRLQAATASRDESAPPSFGPADEADLPVETAAFVGAVIIGFVIILALAVVFGTRSIEGTIEAQTLGLLRANGIRTVDVDANGLEVTLAGAVREER